MIDCGEATQFRLAQLGVPFSKIHYIFISHLHGDHFYGLFGLLSSWAMQGREHPLTIYSPPGLRAMLRPVLFPNDVFPFRITFVETNPELSEVLLENNTVRVTSIPLCHGVACHGFLFCEQPRLPSMRKEKIAQYDIHYRFIPGIKAGADFVTPDGVVVPHSELVLPPGRVRSYAYCSDTMYYEAVIPFVRGVNLLYHEATFDDALAQAATEKKHSTASQAARIAQLAGVGRLLLGHFSARYADLGILLEQAQSVFRDTVLAEELVCYCVE